MNHDEMTKWVFTQIIEGLCAGKPLQSIASNIAFGVANITAQNLKDNQEKKA